MITSLMTMGEHQKMKTKIEEFLVMDFTSAYNGHQEAIQTTFEVVPSTKHHISFSPNRTLDEWATSKHLECPITPQ